MQKIAFALSLSLLPAIALADPSGMPPPIHLLSPSAPLNVKERRAAALARKWAARREMPVRSADGVVRWLYGATMPSIVCSPLHVCVLQLQPGEVVEGQPNLGDSVRWLITPELSGAGADETTNLMIKPTDAGLKTNLVITTNRRVYSINLVSTRYEWTPITAFKYRSDQRAQWAAYQKRMQFAAAANDMPGGEDARNLNFNYRISGDNVSWKPVRVYNDGAHTYIDFPPSLLNGTAPVLVVLSGGGLFSGPHQNVVNYRQDGASFVVDGTPHRMALVEGVGARQRKVTITEQGQ